MLCCYVTLGSVSSGECLGAPAIDPCDPPHHQRVARAHWDTHGRRMSLSAQKQEKSTTKSTKKVKSTLKQIICCCCFYLTHIFEVSRFFWAFFQNLQICVWRGLEGLHRPQCTYSHKSWFKVTWWANVLHLIKRQFPILFSGEEINSNQKIKTENFRKCFRNVKFLAYHLLDQLSVAPAHPLRPPSLPHLPILEPF